MGSALICTPFHDDEKKESKYEIDKNKARSVCLLDGFANKPGFYSQAWFSRIMYREFFDTQIADKGDTYSNIKDATLNWTKCAAHIAAADGLSEEEKEVLIKTQLIWGAGTLTSKELESAIKDGVEMNSNKAANAAKMAINAAGGFDAYTACKQNLYYALTISGVDGLSNQEKDKFREIAKTMNIKQDDIDEIVNVYLMEDEFGKRLNNLLSARDTDKH